MADQRTSDRFWNRFFKPRDGRTGRYTAHETDARDDDEDENSEEPSSATERHEFRGTNGCLQWVTKELLYPFEFVVNVLQRR